MTRYPLTTMFINGHEKYPELVAKGLPLGITPWTFDVQIMLTSLVIRESV